MIEERQDLSNERCSVDFETLHYARVEFFFSEEILFGRGKYDKDSRWEVSDKMDAKIAELQKKYPSVVNDNRYCTQSHGYQFFSSDKEELERYAKELSSYFKRFKCIDAV